MQQKKAPDTSFLFEEEVKTETVGKKEISSGESLTNLRTDLSRFYRLNQKLRSINNVDGAENPAKTVEKLNRMLKTNGIWGANAGEESKAYFVTNGKEVVLVANTVAEWKDVSSREAVYEAFARIDKLLADPFSTALSSYDQRIKEISSEYAENTNDAFRVIDAGMNATWSVAKFFGWKGWEGGNKSYERRIDSVKDEAKAMKGRFEKYYAERLESIGKERINSGDITQGEREELAVLQAQKTRFEKISGETLASPPWLTVELTKFILTERKWDSVKNAGVMVAWVGWGVLKGVFESAKFVFFDAPIFVGKYAFSGEFRTEVNAAVSAAGDAIAKYSEGKDAKTVIADFFKLLGDAMAKEQAHLWTLSPQEQAFRIGEITGSILLMLAGPKVAKDFVASNAVRIKQNYDKINALKAVGKAANIAQVQTWDDLESVVSTIERVRGHKNLWGDQLKLIIQWLRMGDESAKLSSLPKAGGIRETAEKLLKWGGWLEKKTGYAKAVADFNWFDAAVDGSKSAYRKGGEKLNKLFPNTFSKEMSQIGNEFKGLRRVHDALDDKVTNLRETLSGYRAAVTPEKAALWFSDMRVRLGALTSAYAATGVSNSRLHEALSALKSKFPQIETAVAKVTEWTDVAFNGAKDVMATAKARVGAVLDVSMDAVDAAEAKVAKLRGRLPAAIRKNLVFEGGFATYEVPGGGVRYVRPDGTYLKDASGKALEFRHAAQFWRNGAVVAWPEGKFGMIDRSWKYFIEPKYDTIHDLSEGRKIVSVNGKFEVIEKGADGKFGWREKYDFITEPHQGKSIWVRKNPDGTESRFLISDKEGSSGKRLMDRATWTEYEIVDNFAHDGLAAAKLPGKSPNGESMWQIINSDGKILWVRWNDGRAARFVEADNPAEALNRYRDWKAELRLSTDFDRLSKIRREVYAKFPDLEAAWIRVVETDVLGVYRLQKEGKKGLLKGYVNMQTGVKVDPVFQDVFYSDAKEWFLRVKKNGRWWVIDVETGKFNIDPDKSKYVSIQINHERMGLFEVEVNRAVKNAEGKIVRTRQIGLVWPNGQTLIEPKYAYISNPREGLYQGVTYAEGDYSKIVKQSSYFDAATANGMDGFAVGARQKGVDPLSTTVSTALAANDARVKLNSVKKAVDPFRRTLDSMSVSDFFWASAAVFWANATSFDRYVLSKIGNRAPGKNELLSLFDRYSNERLQDFARNYANTERRSLSHFEVVRVREKFQREMKSALSEQLEAANLWIMPKLSENAALASVVRSYSEGLVRNPANPRRQVLKAA